MCTVNLIAKAWGVFCVIALVVSAILVFTFNFLTPLCWAVGFYLIIVVFVVIILELPMFVKCGPRSERLSAWAATLKHWQKGLIYAGLSVFGFLCPLSSLLGALALFLAATLNVFAWLGPMGKHDMNTSNADDAEKLMSTDVEMQAP